MNIDTRTESQGARSASRSLCIAVGPVTLERDGRLPAGVAGMVLFAHGSGSSRHSPRNQAVARALQESGTGTLLFDLLTREEEAEEQLHCKKELAVVPRATHLFEEPGTLEEAARLAAAWFRRHLKPK